MSRATVRLIKRGEQHPYVIEVMTPGWRGCDYGFDGAIKQTMPLDLTEICGILAKANVRYYSIRDPSKEGVMMFMEDGATEFVLRDAYDFEAAITALVRAGWLSEMPVHPTVQ